MYDLLIKNTKLLRPNQITVDVADIAIRGGKIQMVAPAIPVEEAKEVHDAKGLLAFPGLVDGGHLVQVWEKIRKRDAALALEIVHREVLLTQSAREAAQGAYQAVFDQPFGEQLASLEMPILVMAGENDTLRPSLEPAYQLLRNGQMRVIAGEGPYICDTNPQAVAEILKWYFKE